MNTDSVYGKIVSDNGTLLYEGFTLLGKPYGSGTAYFSNGRIYQEGVFGIKGLLCGREYYPSGKLRFEGILKLCKAYSPNYPAYGNCYDQEGELYYSGEIKTRIGGVGYRIVEVPAEFGAVSQREKPDITFFMWEDADAVEIPY